MCPEPFGGNIGDLLLRDGLVTNDALEEAMERQQQTHQPLGRILVDMNAITESVKINFFHRRLGHEIVSLKSHRIPDILFTYFSRATAVKHRVVPYKLEGSTLVVAMEDPSDIEGLDSIKAQAGVPVKSVIASYAEIETALETFPGEESPVGVEITSEEAPSFALRVFKYSFFPVLAFVPLAVVICLLYFDPWFQNQMNNPPYGLTPGEAIFSLVLIWGLWSLIVYEADGILVNPEHRD